MSAVLQEPSSVQRAALTLHALGEHDRQWMLRSLSAAQRRLLQPLLQELDALGIPRDAGLLEPVGAGAREQGAASSPLASLADADPNVLAAIVSAEPARIAQLCACSDGSAPALSNAVAAQVAARLQAPGANLKPLSFWRKARGLLVRRGERR